MNLEPILLFSALHYKNNNVVNLATYNKEVSTLIASVYYFYDIGNDVDYIETVWYDLYNEKYYYSIISFDNINLLCNEKNHIELCYSVCGGLILIISNRNKAYYLDDFIIETIDDRLFEEQIPKTWLYEKNKKQLDFNSIRASITEDVLLIRKIMNMFVNQHIYRYKIIFESWNDENETWDKRKKEQGYNLNYIEESLFDGTFDKLHDDSLLKYHKAGKPKKLAIKWHIKKSEYTAYFWFEDEKICSIFEHFYGAHPDTKTDFIIRIDAERKKYELALFRQGLKEPQIIPEDAYQLLVFKNKFEDYRSDNYNQEHGAWIW